MFKLPKDLIINHVEDLYSQLRELMETGDDIVLDISQVEKTDTACLQLLCVMQKSLQEIGHQITWQGNSEALKSTARMIGVEDFLEL